MTKSYDFRSLKTRNFGSFYLKSKLFKIFFLRAQFYDFFETAFETPKAPLSESTHTFQDTIHEGQTPLLPKRDLLSLSYYTTFDILKWVTLSWHIFLIFWYYKYYTTLVTLYHWRDVSIKKHLNSNKYDSFHIFGARIGPLHCLLLSCMVLLKLRSYYCYVIYPQFHIKWNKSTKLILRNRTQVIYLFYLGLTYFYSRSI